MYQEKIRPPLAPSTHSPTHSPTHPPTHSFAHFTWHLQGYKQLRRGCRLPHQQAIPAVRVMMEEQQGISRPGS